MLTSLSSAPMSAFCKVTKAGNSPAFALRIAFMWPTSSSAALPSLTITLQPCLVLNHMNIRSGDSSLWFILHKICPTHASALPHCGYQNLSCFLVLVHAYFTGPWGTLTPLLVSYVSISHFAEQHICYAKRFDVSLLYEWYLLNK